MLAQKLIQNGTLTKEEFISLIGCYNSEDMEILSKEALRLRKKYYGDQVYTRGLIEFTNYCKNNCYYCGIRCDNKNVLRYRLSQEEILECCRKGYDLGFRTFVLQGGEDAYFNDDRMVSIVKGIKDNYPECAVTLSIGERSRKSYECLFNAGADRYLLRHETANEEHYGKLHPKEMKLSMRKECLYNLKEIGFQTGAGFMVGSPYQTDECLAEDLLFLKELEPQMAGIGPFIPHHDTELKNFPQGTLEKTLFILSIVRIILPKVLLPATTALGTIDAKGREKALLAGANVVMPNLSPIMVRKKYELYDNKICTGEEAAESVKDMEKRVALAGFRLVSERGDYYEFY